MNPISLFLKPYILYIRLGLAVLAILAVFGGWMYVRTLQHDLAVARVAVKVGKDQAIITTGQTSAVAAGATIATERARQDALTITLHQDNAHALEAAPGADAPLDPALNLAGRRGLCRYAAYAGDVSCAGLFQGSAGQLQPAGPAGPTPLGNR